jgi:hypothetical protein
MQATPLNIVAVVTFLIMLPELCAASVRWCKRALSSRLKSADRSTKPEA